MKMKIVGIFDKNTEKERLTVEAVEQCNCKDYIVMDTTYDSSHSVTNLWRHSLVLPAQDLQPGDQVKIYTKKGVNRLVRSNDGTCNIFFVYWGLEVSIWNGDGDVAYLYEISNFVSLKNE